VRARLGPMTAGVDTSAAAAAMLSRAPSAGQPTLLALLPSLPVVAAPINSADGLPRRRAAAVASATRSAGRRRSGGSV